MPRPLEGVTAVTLEHAIAAPFCTRQLADLGARVIKIEEVRGEPMRGARISAGFLSVQRGKEDLALDLKSPRGREILHALVARADVVHHNMRAAALEKLGLDYPSLHAVNPRLVYCHSSGYGNEGPWAALPTLEPLHSALVGLLTRTGGDGNRPIQYLSHMDYGCALTAAAAVIAALVERERTGQGQYLEVPQTGAGLLAMSDVHFEAGSLRQSFRLDREQRGHAATNALYRTADGWITLATYSEQEWRAVATALALEGDWPPYAAARNEPFETSAAARRIESALAGLSSLAAAERLERTGVAAQIPTRADSARLLADPLLRPLGVLALERQDEIGAIWEVGHTIRFERSHAQHRRPAPSLGADTAAILDELGYDAAQIAELSEHKVVRVRTAARTR
jgi:formyl-CoA transferase